MKSQDYCNQTLVSKPDSYDAWYKQGVALMEQNLYNLAVASFDKALTTRSGNEEIWFLRGIALAGLGHYEDAVASFDKATALKEAEVSYGKASIPNLLKVLWGCAVNKPNLDPISKGEIE